ncbi:MULTISPECIES: hypothetical protein [unclassified Sphingobacterium]|uniref:hypothetical protein n=1 Tax=unclassified Sphingobacterium TaxID=2609468 RepID=UPI0025CCDCBB|nr:MULTISPECIES: hypothetical protein [unclassified Sphingobacterium]
MILGITGHQKLEVYDKKWIISEIKRFLIKNDVEKGISCLAAGADQIFCDELINYNIKFDVVIPCHDYKLTFSDNKDLEHYNSLINFSNKIFKLEFDKPSETAFYEAGIEIVRQSDSIIAIWDGEQAKGLGGSGDIVKLALNGNKNVYHINPVNKKVIYLNND